jgi:O-antigen ligase
MPLQRAAKYVQHNVFLSMLTENGAIGLSLFLLLITKLCLFARQVWCYPFVTREGRYLVIVFFGFLAAYFCNGMFQDVLIIPMINSFLLFIAGTLRSLNHSLAGQGIVVAADLQKNHRFPSATIALRAP